MRRERELKVELGLIEGRLREMEREGGAGGKLRGLMEMKEGAYEEELELEGQWRERKMKLSLLEKRMQLL